MKITDLKSWNRTKLSATTIRSLDRALHSWSLIALEKLLGIKRTQVLGAITMGLLVATSQFSYAQATRPDNASARAGNFVGRHCVALEEANLREEIFIVANDPKMWEQGQASTVQISEFLSGRTYLTELHTLTEYEGRIGRDGASIHINCSDSKRSLVLGEPIDSSGQYFEAVNVGSDGRYGPDEPGDKCESPSHCDIGIHGLVLKDRSGAELWGKLIAIRDKSVHGHPTYELPDLYKITSGSFTFGTKLSDGTVVLTIENQMTVRLWLKTGDIVSPHPDVSIVNLKEWSLLKYLLDRRYLHPVTCAARTDAKCRSTVELYFYALRDYLFPRG